MRTVCLTERAENDYGNTTVVTHGFRLDDDGNRLRDASAERLQGVADRVYRGNRATSLDYSGTLYAANFGLLKLQTKQLNTFHSQPCTGGGKNSLSKKKK